MKIKTLIVDDESIVRKGLRAMLSRDCFEIDVVGEAGSGEQALEFMEHNPVQLLFCDITMPKMSGLVLLEQVNQRFPQVKTVILTCHQDFDYIQEALRHGAIDYIVKTQIDEQNLEQLMEAIVNRIRRNMTDSPKFKQRTLTDTNCVRELWTSLQWIIDDDYFRKMFDETDRMTEEERNPIIDDALYLWRKKLSFMLTEEWLLTLQSVPYGKLDRTLRMEREPIMNRFLRSGYSEEVIRSIMKAIDFMHNNIGGKLSQGSVCSAINMSSSYLSKSFKEIMGVTFANYLQDVNIQYASSLLQTTNQPVYLIAEKCGFQDEKYFSRLFKIKMGMLPSQYRQSKR